MGKHSENGVKKWLFTKNRLSTILIVAGVIVLLIPIVGRLYNNYEQKLMNEAFEQNQEEILLGLDESFAETDPDAISEAAVSERPAAIGRIKIPSIDASLLIFEGSTSKELNWGAGHITGTVMPGELGNCAIAGHRNYTFGSYFSRLGEVVTGDAINLEYNGNTYKYIVYQIKVVDPTDVSVLRQGKADEEIVTLITCHPKGKNTHRLIVKASMRDHSAVYDQTETPDSVQAEEPVGNQTGNVDNPDEDLDTGEFDTLGSELP